MSWRSTSVLLGPAFPLADTAVPLLFLPGYDIALVELALPSSALTVMLPNKAGPSPGETVWAAGYGDDDSGEASPDLLRYTSLSVLDDYECPMVSCHCCVAVALPLPPGQGSAGMLLICASVCSPLPAGGVSLW